jgi:glycosyltransferase involved in cell wall biosynthesis
LAEEFQSELYVYCIEMKVGIFTPYPLNPMHPRTEMYLAYFGQMGIEASIEQYVKKKNVLLSMLSKAFINMFDFEAVRDLADKIKSYDVVLIQDLKYLPLSIDAKKARKKVVYETLDNSVFIRVYHQHSNAFFPVIKFLTPLFCRMERFLAKKYTDAVIVNSLTLKGYFNHKVELIYYSSPFETANIKNDSANKPAFLYLGAITESKGILEIFFLIDTYKIPVYLFGDCNDPLIEKRLLANPLITWKNRLSSSLLKAELMLVTKEFYLIGISLIKPVHYSYATQEANKEIDYLAMGIPFIGNHRLTTQEKIAAGCGVFLDDPEAITLLLNDAVERTHKSLVCQQYYAANYSFGQFQSKASEIFNKQGHGR